MSSGQAQRRHFSDQAQPTVLINSLSTMVNGLSFEATALQLEAVMESNICAAQIDRQLLSKATQHMLKRR